MRSFPYSPAKEVYRRQLFWLDFIDDKRRRDGLRQQNIEFFCEAFYQVLQCTKVGNALDLSIYCVIDGIG
ncbi:hypothetical protein SAMD00023353_9600250 [Rosellinia necatrix]|uniref:Uncharacterized protein n=1 Tax=Rosellinia necatrix TaxID=77044 RepID=A0A1S8AAZ3_ROSNE|nr:hypothetical protein SAMD00023353_9600250 [Rosellinia necatrix]